MRRLLVVFVLCGVVLAAAPAASAVDVEPHLLTASLPLISVPGPAHTLSAKILRGMRNSTTRVVAARPDDRAGVSEHEILAQGTVRQRRLVTAIQLARFTDLARGPVDARDIVTPSFENKLVWIVIAHDYCPFVSGPVTLAGTKASTSRRHCPSETSYLWTALDARTGKFLEAQTFSMPL